MTTATPDSTATDTEDRLAIIELIGRLSLTIDAKDWDAMGQLFTDTVYHDRTSLTGGDPYTAPVAQFVERMAPNAAEHGRCPPPDHQSRD